MPLDDFYYTVESPLRAPDLKVKGSRFIADIAPMETKENVEHCLTNIRKEFHDASHHSFAYRLGAEALLVRAADDGEPTGTAGKPILLVLTSRKLTNVLLVVTRFFGGTKLGTGGLARAYAEAAQQAVSMSKVVKVFLTKKVSLEVHYEDLPAMERSEARKKLSIPDDAPAILFFGYIRKYKGLDILLRAMPRIIESLPDIRLIVAGEFYGDVKEYRSIIQELRIPAKNLVLATDYIPNDDVALYFSAANVAVLPYRSATQSGIVQIAYNFDVPVIATNVGGLAEIVIDGISGIITPDATPDAIAEAVRRYFQQSMEPQLTEGVIQEKKKYSWNTFAEGIEKLLVPQ